MAEALESLPAESAVDRDWPCIQCGYNLRTLSRDANCPECGVAVAESLKTLPLSLADPRWQKKVQVASLMLFGIALGCLVLKALPIWFRWLTLNRGPLLLFSIGGQNAVLRLAWPLFLLPAAIASRPPRRRDEPARRPRQLLLPVVCAHLLLLAFTIAVRLIWWGGWNKAFNAASAVEPTFLPVEFWLIFQSVEALAERIPGKPLQLESRIARVIFCLLLSINALGFVILELRNWYGYFPRWLGLGAVYDPHDDHSLFIALIHMFNMASWLLIPLWFYFPIFLLRFQLHLRRATRADLAL